jgi:hypothetical protein
LLTLLVVSLVALLLTDQVGVVSPAADAGEPDRATAPTVNVDIMAAAAKNRGAFLKDLVISI